MRYKVRAQRVGQNWELEVPGVPGALSMVRRLEQAQEHAREAIAFVLGVPVDSFEVELEAQLPDDWDNAITEARELKALAERAVVAAASVSRRTAAQLHQGAGLSVRDVGFLMGISPQRVSQLLEATPRPPYRTRTEVLGRHS
jgi:hypothetical protein